MNIDSMAHSAMTRYESFSGAITALHDASLISPELGNVDFARSVYSRAYMEAERYFEADKLKVEEDFHKIALEARGRVLSSLGSTDAEEMSDAALELLSETQTYLSNEIAAQIHRDIGQLRRGLQSVALSVSVLQRGKGMSPRQAQMAYVISNTPKLDLYFADRRGRKTPSGAFVRLVYRQSLLSAHNEIVLHTLADHGIEHAAVMKMDGGTPIQIDTISIYDYASRRDELFHPNSNAYLDAERHDV